MITREELIGGLEAAAAELESESAAMRVLSEMVTIDEVGREDGPGHGVIGDRWYWYPVAGRPGVWRRSRAYDRSVMGARPDPDGGVSELSAGARRWFTGRRSAVESLLGWLRQQAAI